MRSVGIRTLKNELSKYLKMVRAGELVYVTDRDEIIAEIRRPTQAVAGQISRLEAYMNELELQGSIRRARTGVLTSALKSSKRSRPDLPRIIAEIREDRF